MAVGLSGVWIILYSSCLGFIYFTPNDAIWCQQLLTNVGSGNGVLPDNTKP